MHTRIAQGCTRLERGSVQEFTAAAHEVQGQQRVKESKSSVISCDRNRHCELRTAPSCDTGLDNNEDRSWSLSPSSQPTLLLFPPLFSSCIYFPRHHLSDVPCGSNSRSLPAPNRANKKLGPWLLLLAYLVPHWQLWPDEYDTLQRH